MPIPISQTLYSHPTDDPSPVLRVRRKFKGKEDDPQDVEEDDPGMYSNHSSDDDADAEELGDMVRVIKHLGKDMPKTIHNYFMGPDYVNKRRDYMKLRVSLKNKNTIWLIELPYEFHYSRRYDELSYSVPLYMLQHLNYDYDTSDYHIKILGKSRDTEGPYQDYLAIMIKFKNLENSDWTDDVEPIIKNMCRRWRSSTVRDWKFDGDKYINLN
jgi:hypothetical protein